MKSNYFDYLLENLSFDDKSYQYYNIAKLSPESYSNLFFANTNNKKSYHSL